MFVIRTRNKAAIDPIEICTTLTTALKGNGLIKKDNLGRTPLHWAAYRGAGTCCMHLIKVSIHKMCKNVCLCLIECVCAHITRMQCVAEKSNVR